jgi:putative PIN family toxin of toxin-antitoxin system
VIWGGKPAKITQLAEDGRIRILVTPDLLTEINRILDYSKLKVMLERSKIRKDVVLVKIAQISHVTQTRRTVRVIAEDPADNRILECALAGKAEYVVSGDRHLLHLDSFKGIRILDVSEFLAVMKRGTRD